jgi:hypothetical protein
MGIGFLGAITIASDSELNTPIATGFAFVTLHSADLEEKTS